MGYTNPKELLIALPAPLAAIEERLPEGAPAISAMLVDAAEKMPALPDFFMELPDLPAVPELPEFTPPGNGELRKRSRIVEEAEIRPKAPTPAAKKTRFLY